MMTCSENQPSFYRTNPSLIQTAKSGRFRDKGRRLISILLFFGLAPSLAGCGPGAIDFQGRVVDAETGQPVVATVSVTNSQGEAVELNGNHGHVEYLDRRWCYVDGAFALSTDNIKATIEIRRGPETLPLQEEIDLSSGQKTFSLKRWIRMNDEGFVSGDGHVHYLSLDDSHLQMRAEDLNVLNLLTSDFTGDLEKFTGALDPISTHSHSVYVGQEFRDWQHGHINLLGIKQIIEPLKPFGGRFGTTSRRNLLLTPTMREASRQGGAVAWAHFSNLPGAESPIAFALGLVDAVELVAYDDPTELPSHWWPWRESGMSQAEFPILRGQDLYYQYLNAGFQLPITAGTDKMGENIPVGSNRLYAQFDSEPSYEEWLHGMKTGNGFITNGPLLTFEVDGQTMGNVVEFSESRPVSIQAEASSILPFSQLEIVLNGKVTHAAPKPEKDEQGVFRTRVDGGLTLQESSWIAARVARPTGERNRILPRELTVYAHTNPIYFLRDGKQVRQEASIRYLITYVRASMHWYRTGAVFESEAVRKEALHHAEEALRVYETLLR